MFKFNVVVISSFREDPGGGEIENPLSPYFCHNTSCRKQTIATMRVSTAFAFISCAFGTMQLVEADVSSIMPTVCIAESNISQCLVLRLTGLDQRVSLRQFRG
jgi:hypothetical protein